MTWFKAVKYIGASNKKWVQPIEIEKFTEHSVWIQGSRNNRRSDFDNYFPTKEEAYSAISGRIKGKIEHLEFELQQAKKELEQIEAERAEIGDV